MPAIFPSTNEENVGFFLTNPGSDKPFSVLMVAATPDGALWGSSSGQFFPRYRFVESDAGKEPSLFTADAAGPSMTHNVTDLALADYRARVGDHVTRDDIFFYAYGLLHSADYRERYAADLTKVLPRIPISANFQQFCDAGRRLADLHLGYESVEPFALEDSSLGASADLSADHLRVEKMVFGKVGGAKDRSTIIYNRFVTLSGIPEDAYRYMLGARSAVEWVMDRYQVKVHKESGIVNDPNDWCDEAGDPRYIIDLVKRVVTVSIETMKIVDALPALDIIE